MKTDKNDNIIGDGTYHTDYDIEEFSKHKHIHTSISKSACSESVYVTYRNILNLKQITVRFSNHTSNSVEFGDVLNGNTYSKNEIMYHLGLINRRFIPKKRLHIYWKYVKKTKIDSYKTSDKTIKELYSLGVGADLSCYKNKLCKNSNILILGDTVEEIIETKIDIFGSSVQLGHYEYK